MSVNSSQPSYDQPPAVLAFGSTVASVLLATLLRWLLDPLLGGELPFIMFLVAVIFSAWYGGTGAGLLAIVLGTLVGDFLFVEPRGSLGLFGVVNLVDWGMYAGIGGVAVLLGASQRAAQRRAYYHLRGLEQQIAERTKAESGREQAQQSLRQNEEHLRFALSAANMGTWRWIVGSNLITQDANVNRIYGYESVQTTESFEQFLARIYPEDLPRVQAALNVALSSRESYDQEFRILLPDGALRWVRNRGQVIADERETPLYMTGVLTDITERKLTEQSLDESRLRLQALFDNTLDAILITNDTGDFVDANYASTALTGYSRSELLERNMLDFVVGSEQEIVIALWQVFLREGIQSGEYQIGRRDGGVLVVEYHAVARIVPGLHLVVVRDITERKQAEVRNRLLQQLMPVLTEALTLHDVTDVVIRHVGAAMGAHVVVVVLQHEDGETIEVINHTGLPDSTYLRHRLTSLNLPTPLTDAVRTATPVWIETQEAYAAHYPGIMEDIRSSTNSQAIACLPMVAHGRTIGGLCVAFHEPRQFDDHDRRFLIALAAESAHAMERARLFEAEHVVREALQERVRQHSLIAVLGQTALASDDLDRLMDNTVRALASVLNVEYCKILELLPDGGELFLRAGVGWKAGFVGRAKVGTGRESQAGFALMQNEPVIVEDFAHETRFTDYPMLREHDVMSGMSVVIPGQMKPYGVLGVHTRQRRVFTQDDVYFLQSVANILASAIERQQAYDSERKARLEAEAANKVKLTFLGMISHELRTPLTSIKGFTSSLLATDVEWSEEQEREFIEIMDEEANKLGDLVGQLLDVSSLEAGTLRIQPKPIAFKRILDDALAQLVSLTLDHPLDTEVAPHLPPVVADMQRIGQVIVNLVDNAAKYSPPGSPIKICVTRLEGYLQVDVIDRGEGIAPAEREVVFEAFRQATRLPRQRGAGLGLAICKGVVEAHGGRIWIQNRSGPGTTISFTLPFAADASDFRGGDELTSPSSEGAKA